MKKLLFTYAVKLTVDNNTSATIEIKAPSQAILELFEISLYYNDVTGSDMNVILYQDNTAIKYQILTNFTIKQSQRFYFPSTKDNIKYFDKYEPRSFLLTSSDILNFNFDSLVKDKYLYFGFRTLSTIYAKPTITYTNLTVNTEYSNKVVGVI